MSNRASTTYATVIVDMDQGVSLITLNCMTLDLQKSLMMEHMVQKYIYRVEIRYECMII